MAETLDQSPAYCEKCGHLSKDWTDSRRVAILSETDVLQLIAFMHQAMDEAWCELCKHRLKIRPTILFLTSDPEEAHIVLGTLAQANRTSLISGTADLMAARGKNVKPSEVGSLNELRNLVAARLRNNLSVGLEFLEADKRGQTIEFVTANWSRLSSKFFAAVLIGTEIPQLRLQLLRKDGTELPKDEILRLFATAQAYSWLGLWQAWAQAEATDRCFEEDLSRHITPGAILPDAVDLALKAFVRIENDHELKFPANYCLEAIRSSLFQVSDNTNPFASKWARRFFELEVANAIGESAVRDKTTKLTVSAARAEATIPFEAAWDAIIPFINGDLSSPKLGDALRQISTKAGHSTLLDQLPQAMEVSGIKALTGKQLVRLLISAKQDQNLGVTEAIAFCKILTSQLLESGQIEELEEVALGLLDMFERKSEARARIEAWLGECYKILRLPQRFLDRISSLPQEWEQKLPPYEKAILWTERSSALRLVGKAKEALEVIEEVLKIFPSAGAPADRRVAERNRAILLRETGASDLALEALSKMLLETAGAERLDFLETMIITLCDVGQLSEALRCIDAALNLAHGPYSSLNNRFRASKALVLTLLNEDDEALKSLIALDDDLELRALLAAGSAWTNILDSDTEIPAEAYAKLESLYDSLFVLFEQSEANADVQSAVAAIRIIARVVEIVDHDKAPDFYRMAYETCKKHKQAPNYTELIPLARYACQKGEAEQGRAYLRQIPYSLAAAAGGGLDILLASRGHERRLKARLLELTETILEKKSSFEDIRLMADVNRDAMGRAQSLRRSMDATKGSSIIVAGYEDRDLSSLAWDNPIVIFEWISSQRLIANFITVIQPDGSIASHWLHWPKIDLSKLAVRIESRLSTWRPSRLGDPFDLPDWHHLERWLNETLENYIPSNGHIVFIEHPDYAGIPWHVAGRRWSSSYASSRTALLTLGTPNKKSSSIEIGVILVPEAKEAAPVIKVLRESAERTRAFAANLELDFSWQEEARKCDRNEFQHVMQHCTVVKLLCHGFVDQNEDEISLMLAHDESLPPALSVAANTPAGRRHRLSWRECQRLSAAPSVIFSAACRTGSTHITGIGERIGLFAGLRRAGTRTIVAPRWDLFVKETLPILDETLEQCLGEGISLAAALHNACGKAEQWHSLWLAWNLSIEGDWR